MTVDYIIVGLGLAGMAFCKELIDNSKTFVVLDNDSQKASLVGTGVYNPIILKRFTPAWDAEPQLTIALPFYKSLSTLLGKEFDFKFSTKRVLNSIQEQNNWNVASERSVNSKYMLPEISTESYFGLKSPFGFGLLQHTGRIDTESLSNAFKKHLVNLNLLRNTSLNYDELIVNESLIKYQDIIATRVVFCEGFGLKSNPFFNYLPMQESKGEIITIFAPDLKIDFLVKSSVFILPIGDDYYKIGATFNWHDKTNLPTERGLNELKSKLDKLLLSPYTITNHQAAIRPTTKDRRPFVGRHPDHQHLFVLNGLGTRGTMLAPKLAKSLFSHIENNTTIESEFSITRFDT